jgi:hypothetical protein
VELPRGDSQCGCLWVEPRSSGQSNQELHILGEGTVTLFCCTHDGTYQPTFPKLEPACMVVHGNDTSRASRAELSGSRQQHDNREKKARIPSLFQKIIENAYRIRERYEGLGKICDHILEELLNPGLGPVVLQLGGHDAEKLSMAAAIATAFGFQGVNLNCGCPGTSVSARATGAALMREPDLVARCLEAMSERMALDHT